MYDNLKIVIGEGHLLGRSCVENEVPWMPPEAIFYLNDNCLRPEDIVLDLGSGGSTFFFARRCMKVFSIETNMMFARIVTGFLSVRNISNVNYFCQTCASQLELEKLLIMMNNMFSVISVDTHLLYNRTRFLDILMDNNKESVRAVIIDNYSSPVLFPDICNLSIEEMVERYKFNGKAGRGKEFNAIVSGGESYYGTGCRILEKV